MTKNFKSLTEFTKYNMETKEDCTMILMDLEGTSKPCLVNQFRSHVDDAKQIIIRNRIHSRKLYIGINKNWLNSTIEEDIKFLEDLKMCEFVIFGE